MAGGQPASMANIKAVHELCQRHGIPVMLDATRALENAWFIQQREAGYEHRSVEEILREICDHSEGATVSSKKDNLVNIGGFLALRDADLARKAPSPAGRLRGPAHLRRACPGGTWRRWPWGSARWSRPTTTSPPASGRSSTSATS